MRGQSIAPLRARRAAPLPRVPRLAGKGREEGEGAGRRAAGAVRGGGAAVQCGRVVAAWPRVLGGFFATERPSKMPFSSLAAVSRFSHRSILSGVARTKARAVSWHQRATIDLMEDLRCARC